MKVVIADVRQEQLDQAMTYFSQKKLPVHAIRLDITDRKAYARAADEAERVFGPIDLLCNTAGVSQFGPIEQASDDDWDWQIDVNVKGMINGVQIFMPRMIKRGAGGHIVNTASMSAFVALPQTGIYCTTKYAVRGLSESLRIELEKYNIGVSLLCPGGVNTNIHESVLSRPGKVWPDRVLRCRSGSVQAAEGGDRGRLRPGRPRAGWCVPPSGAMTSGSCRIRNSFRQSRSTTRR